MKFDYIYLMYYFVLSPVVLIQIFVFVSIFSIGLFFILCKMILYFYFIFISSFLKFVFKNICVLVCVCLCG